MKRLLLLSFFVFVSVTLAAQGALSWSWAKAFPSTAMIGSTLGAACDSQGNTYACGGFSGTTNFEVGSVTAVGVEDGFILKINSSGMVVWVATCTSSAATIIEDVITDASGNVYVCGRVFGNGTFGSITLSVTGLVYRAFVAKLNSSGQWQWVKDGFSADGEEANSLCRMSEGNFYVVATNMSNGNFAVSKLTSGGDQIWRSSSAGSTYYNAKTRRIILDHTGNALFLAHFMGNVTFDNYTVSQTGNYSDFVVAKISPSGNWLWAQDLDAYTSFNNVWGLAVDNNNDVYVTGDYNGSVTMGSYTLTTSQTWDMMMFKLNSLGQAVAGIDNETSTIGAQLRHIIPDQANNFYVYGLSGSSSTMGGITVPLGFFLGKINSAGQWQEIKVQQNTTTADCVAFATDGAGHLILGGTYNGAPVFGSITLPSPSMYAGIWVAKTGNFGPTGNADQEVPEASISMAIQPNPSQGEMNLVYDLPKSDKVKIEIYNIRGQLVKELLSGAQSQGEHAIRWDRTDRYGKNVSAGIYIIHLKTPTEIFSSKFLALK